MQATVMISGHQANGDLAFGSGVIVDQNCIVTNCHTLRHVKEAWVTHGEHSFAVQQIKADPYYDICLLKVEGLSVTPVETADTNSIQYGQTVLSIGHSNGVLKPLTAVGHVTSRYRLNNGNLLRSTAPFRLGASGSGLFDTEGRLVGINTFKTPGAQAFYYALPIDWIAPLANQTGESTLPIQGEIFWEVAEETQPFFMQIALVERQEQWNKMLLLAERWLETSANVADAWFSLAIAHSKLNDILNAKKAFQEIKALDQHFYATLDFENIIEN